MILRTPAALLSMRTYPSTKLNSFTRLPLKFLLVIVFSNRRQTVDAVSARDLLSSITSFPAHLTLGCFEDLCNPEFN